MSNRELAKIFFEMAELLEIKEYLKSGRVKDYEKLKKEMPVDVSGLAAIEGVGPKTIKILYKKLKIKNAGDLEKATRAGKLKRLPRFGEKLEEKILKGIEFQKTSAGRMNIGEALPLARKIVNYLKYVPGVEKIEPAGSLRRRQENVGDLDFLAISSKPELVMNKFVSMPEVEHIYARGDTKSMVRLRSGIDADLRVLAHESFGAAQQYFTSSKDHNVEVRKIAIKYGYKLNEYGLFKGKKAVAAADEKEIYKKLGLDWMTPELRLAYGEIEAAQKHKLPKLIGYGDLKGDLQTQTSWTDGANAIEEMAKEAKRLGHEYICITDHTKGLAMTGGSDEKKLSRQAGEIDRLNKEISGIEILKGAEVNISKDGSLDIADEALAKLDFAGAAIHSLFGLSEKEQTERFIKAMRNPHIDIIFHPTGRVPMRREPIKLDFEAVFKEAARSGTMLEINAHPWRLDLHGELVREAKKYGVKFMINTDAHSTGDLSYLEYGIAQARRGWAEKKDIINTFPLKKLLELLKKPKVKRF